MLQKTQAIVLHAVKYGDTSLIVHAFTEAWGRSSFLLKGIRKSKKSNRANMFQALSLLNLDIYYRDNRDLQWIKEASYPGSTPASNNDVVKSTQAIFLSEVLMKTIREEERNPELFNFLFESLKYFNSPADYSPSFHILFLFQLTKYLGFYPMNNFSSGNIFFNPETGSFSSIPISTKTTSQKSLGEQWKACFIADYHTADQVFKNQEDRNAFLDSLLHFYRLHQHSMRELKSLEVLRTVFS